MTDLVVFIAMITTFALTLTTHVTIAIGLLWRKPRWRALVALLVAPLAPYWAWKERMRVRAVVWVLGVAGYVVARVIEKGD